MVISFHWIGYRSLTRTITNIYPPHGGADGEDGTLWHVATLFSSKIGIQELSSITMRPRQRLLNQPTSSAHVCGNGLSQFHLKWVESVLSNIMW
jgi:hypothetical protein